MASASKRPEPELILVLECANGGDLKQLLNTMRAERADGTKPVRFDEHKIWRYFLPMARGVKHMHDRKVIHRDLKPANILFHREGRKTTIKLADLGLARGLTDSEVVARSKVGTPLYMAPEVIKGKAHDYKADVWSLGCILYELMALKSPFKEPGLSLPGLMQKIR